MANLNITCSVTFDHPWLPGVHYTLNAEMPCTISHSDSREDALELADIAASLVAEMVDRGRANYIARLKEEPTRG